MTSPARKADTNNNLVAAHIHAGPLVTPTTNGPVVCGFFGAPFNDNTPNDLVFALFATGVGGTISGKWDAPEGNGTTLAAQLANILGGHSYNNFHTVQFGGGEIRGNIGESAGAVHLGMMILGLAGLKYMAYRRRQQFATFSAALSPSPIRNLQRDRLRAVFLIAALPRFQSRKLGRRPRQTVVSYSRCVPEMGAGNGAEGPCFKTEANGAMGAATFIEANGRVRKAKAASPCGRSA